ncbi:MAG TPA: methyltransferase domain-containing protein [Vicinamibacterales bacterium]|nr:methyltransferase domain-containing protein [Vicinamibacterales bacterium]
MSARGPREALEGSPERSAGPPSAGSNAALEGSPAPSAGPPSAGSNAALEGSPERERGTAERGHYSYAVYADPGMAERFDAMRFGGPIGTLIAESQERVLVDFLGDVRGRSILDVGTGTGRAALALATRGAAVRGLDASSEMLAVARRRADSAGLDVEFTTGDAHALPLADRSVDAAVSLRVLMHTPGWGRCVAELCRVARHQVIVDFPAAASAAWLQSAARTWRLARHREAYRVFTLGTMRQAFAANGFAITRVHRQFVLPIALHKAIGSRAFTRVVEGAFAALGLLRLFGSPVTVLAERE